MRLWFLGTPFGFQLDPLMTTSGLEKSDLGKNRFYSALNKPYRNGKIIAVERVQTFIGQWGSNNFAVVIRNASVPMPLHAAICPHTCKLISDWLGGLVLVCACFIYEFLPRQEDDEMDNTVLADPLYDCQKRKV